MEVVGSLVVSTWRRLRDAAQGQRLPMSTVMGMRLLSELGATPLVKEPVKRAPPPGEGDGEAVRRTVTRDELWEWLFSEPAPHGCLAFLDHDGDGIRFPVVSGRQAEAEEVSDAHAADEYVKERIAIFGAIGPHLATNLPQGRQWDGLMPTERLLKRLHAIRTSTLCIDLNNISDIIKRVLKTISSMPGGDELLQATLESTDEAVVLGAFASFAALLRLMMAHLVDEAETVLFMREVNRWSCLDGIAKLSREHPNARIRSEALLSLLRAWREGLVDRNCFVEVLSEGCRKGWSDSLKLFYDGLVDELDAVTCSDEMIAVALPGIEAEKEMIVAAALRFVSCYLEVNMFEPESEEDFFLRVMQVLVRNLTYPTDCKTLTELAAHKVVACKDLFEHKLPGLPADCLGHLSKAKLDGGKDRKRPNLHSFATSGERHATSDDADPSTQLHQEMIRCMKQLCSCACDGWFDVLVETIKPRLSHDVPWQVRECGLYLVSIMGTSRSSRGWEYASGCIAFIKSSLRDRSAKVRAMSCWTISGLLIATNGIYGGTFESRDLEELISCLLHAYRDEKDEFAKKIAFASLHECVEKGLLRSCSDAIFSQLIDSFLEDLREALLDNGGGVSSSAVSLNSMRMLSCWVAHVARGPDEVLRVLPRLMELIELCCPPPSSALSVTTLETLQSIVSSVKKDLEPYLEPACKFIRRHLEAALQSPAEDDALTRYEQAGIRKGLELVVAMLDNKLDALCWINPSLLMDWIEAADWASKQVINEDQRSFSLLFPPLQMLAELTRHVPASVTKYIGTRGKESFIRTILQRAISVPSLDHVTIVVIGLLSIYIPSVVESEWIVMACRLFKQASRCAEFQSQALLQMGWHFAHLVPAAVASWALESPTMSSLWWREDEMKERLSEMIGSANLVLHNLSRADNLSHHQVVLAVKVGLRLARHCVDIKDSVFMTENDGEQHHHDDDQTNLEETIRDLKSAICGVLRAVINKEMLPHLDPRTLPKIEVDESEDMSDERFFDTLQRVMAWGRNI